MLTTEPGGQPHNARLYLVYTDEAPPESNDTDIYIRSSDNNGGTWSSAVKVNDDATTRSQFLPHLSVDQTTGQLAITWHDSRNDSGIPGSGSTNAVPNDDAMYYGAFSTNFGASFLPNFQISAGVSNDDAANNGVDYGDYTWSDYRAGHLHAAWADNSNSTLDNPNGTLHQFDIYTAHIAPTTAVGVTAFRAERTAHGAALTWRATEELSIVGFDVYRTAAGRTLKVNRALILARAAGRAEAGRYRFVDRGARAGQAYRYRLQVVGADGTRIWRGVAALAG